VSVSSAGTPANGLNIEPSISHDGRFVAFGTDANNLVVGDTRTHDIFVRDRLTNQTTRVSVDNGGAGGEFGSYNPSISANGLIVAFESYADNLVVGDTNLTRDVFIRNRATNQTSRMSVSSAGTEANIFSHNPSISANGLFVAFESAADNLVAGDFNTRSDIFVRDRTTNQTTRVSVNNAGIEGNDSSGSAFDTTYLAKPSISAGGRCVAFVSLATNLVAGDTNGARDIFVRDRAINRTTRVSVNSNGVQGNNESVVPSINADCRFVTFASSASNLVAGDTNGAWDVFVRDRATNQTSRVSLSSTGLQGNGISKNPTISADGRYVAFESFATNLMPGDTNGDWDFFVRDRVANQTTRVSVSSTGVQGNNSFPIHSASTPSISADGRYIVFQSDLMNLAPGDSLYSTDVFVRDRLLNTSTTADLILTQSVSANPVRVGANFFYTATLTNKGPNNAGNVVLTEFAPLDGTANLQSLSPSQGSCYRGTISVCRMGTINAGKKVTLRMNFTALKVGTVVNRVTANASPKDPTSFNANTTTTKVIP
jgi:uncharacterized repeat protein (TIGR01451 family)